MPVIVDVAARRPSRTRQFGCNSKPEAPPGPSSGCHDGPVVEGIERQSEAPIADGEVSYGTLQCAGGPHRVELPGREDAKMSAPSGCVGPPSIGGELVDRIRAERMTVGDDDVAAAVAGGVARGG